MQNKIKSAFSSAVFVDCIAPIIFSAIFLICTLILPRHLKDGYYPKVWQIVASAVLPFLAALALFVVQKSFSGLRYLLVLLVAVSFVYNLIYTTVRPKHFPVFTDYYFWFILSATCMVILAFVLIRLFAKGLSSEQKNSFVDFFHTVAYAVFFLNIIYIFHFFITLRISAIGTYRDVRLIPFTGTMNYFSKIFVNGRLEVDFLAVTFGNILFFTPLGFYTKYFFPKMKKWLFFVLPFALSVSIEASQFILKNGQTDIDDVILNVLGFYLGITVYLLVTKIDKSIFTKEVA